MYLHVTNFPYNIANKLFKSVNVVLFNVNLTVFELLISPAFIKIIEQIVVTYYLYHYISKQDCLHIIRNIYKTKFAEKSKIKKIKYSTFSI